MKKIICIILSSLQILFSFFGIAFYCGRPIAIVDEGESDYVITFDSDTALLAAFALQEKMDAATGACLSVSEEADNGFIRFQLCEDDRVGNYGYKIFVDNGNIIVGAASLAGFDMAIERLLCDTVSDSRMEIREFYTANKKLTWESDYTINADDYNPAYRSDTFYNDKNDSVAYVANAMWHMFGLVDDGQDLVYRFGNEAVYFEWVAEKIAWSNDAAYKNELKDKIRDFPQTATGYLWSWGTYPHWKVDDYYAVHYDGNFRYISAVYEILAWENSTDFLNCVDLTADSGEYASMDSSKNKTVLEKTEAAMRYILEYLNGKKGLIQITEESTYLNADGTERFDYVMATDEYCWDNTGKNNSSDSNYWDRLCFGNYSAYENALFYQALHSMAGIYKMLGGEYNDKAEYLEKLADEVKENFNAYFWSEENGRYIACIDTDGNRIDYGLTFLNFEAVKYGLADEEKAEKIFSWIDGERIVAEDTKTGDEILSYAEIMKQIGTEEYLKTKIRKLRLAAATNTVSYDNKENKITGSAWWSYHHGIDVWGNASYGRNQENGGYIFYPVFYELMARTSTKDAQSTTDRFADMARVYEYNRLQSDQGVWVEGLNGEYPENGLVPTAYLYSLVGVQAEYDGLYIAPKFNNVYEFMGAKNVVYAGNSYGIEVNRDSSLTITAENDIFDMTLQYAPEKFTKKQFEVIAVYSDGTRKTCTVLPDAHGVISFDLNDTGVSSITVKPILVY